MYKTGVFFGKLIPPHRGHLMQIIYAATKCEKLYVVVSDNKKRTERICKEAGIDTITAEMRVQWLCQELQDLEHVNVVILDETNIPEYPNGWTQWTDLMRDLIPTQIDAFFCGEQVYKDNLPKYFPKAEVVLFDPSRTKYPISATEIRKNPTKNWDYIIGPARPHFTKKVLIVGTESCGKTTLTKYLAKMYHTSWSEEVGRYYAQKYLGGNETIFTPQDFGRIAHLQYEQDYHALRTANKICFFDTDATVTQYYSTLYMGSENSLVEMYIDSNRYDLVLFLTPDVKWVDDGQRLNGDDEKRWELHEKLKNMFISRGFGDKIVEIKGDYLERLQNSLAAIENKFDNIGGM